MVLLVAQNELNGLAWLIWGGAALLVVTALGGWSSGLLGGRKGLVVAVALLVAYTFLVHALTASAGRLRKALELNDDHAGSR